MQRYDSYKDSGVEWLGEVPSHWEIKKNKYLLEEKQLVVGNESANYQLLSLTLRGVVLRDMKNPKGKFPAEFNTYKIVYPNDLVFCLFDVEETPRAVGHSDNHGMITGAYTIVKCCKDISSKYIYYYYLSLDHDKRLKPLYTGLRNVITRDTFFSIKSPVPPKEEQDRIVAFLDEKTAEIDTAIAKKERLIELLKEQKNILINRAVTRGLNPDATMRDSGLEWIGEIPAHYTLNRIGFLASVGNGSTPNSGNKSYWNSGNVPWLNSSKINDLYISTANQFVTQKALKQCHLPMVTKGSLLVAITGEGKTRGMTALCNMDSTINQHLAYIKITDSRIIPEYLLFYLTGMYKILRSESSGVGSTKGAISCEELKIFPVLLPPLKEQEEIVSMIKKQERIIDYGIYSAKNQIKLLNEFRVLTISYLITGRLKI